MTSEEIRAWCERVLEPVLRGESVDEMEARQAGGLALLSADADKIKDYVFESAKLPEIRGASMILDELNQGWLDDKGPNIRKLFAAKGLPVGRRADRKAPSCIIYAGGGSLLALVPHDLAEILKADIEVLYPRETGIATITCVWRPVSPRELQEGYNPDGFNYDALLALRERLTDKEWRRIADYYRHVEGGDEVTRDQFEHRKNFGELMALQAIELRRAKESKETAPLLEAIPYNRRCDSCEIRPASEFKPEPSPRYLCWVCAKKVDRSERGKKEWIKRFENFLEGPGRAHCDLEKYLDGVPSLDNVEQARDLEEIGAASAREGYVGFIFADGNGVGAMVEQSETIQMYKENSDALTRILAQTTEDNIVYAALCRHIKVKKGLKRKDRRGRTITVNVHPFEIITIGGDDLLLIVPGDVALAIATDICQAFEDKLPKAGFQSTRKPTMSAGVVIADHHNPVYFMRDLAEQLLKNAKKRARELEAEGNPKGTIDFLVLKSQSTLATSLKHLRSSPPYLFTSKTSKERVYLTQRPYTLQEMDRLIDTAQMLKGFPASQLQGLRQTLYRGRLYASVSYLYQYVRASKRHRQLLYWIEKQWGVGGVKLPPPWIQLPKKRDYAQYQTPWADIIEVLDFVPSAPEDKRRRLEKEIYGGGEAIESGN
jgi:CRISPR-associated protein Cmr2